MEEQATRRLTSAFDSPTFGEDGSFQVDKPVGSMSISPCGRDVVLASRQGLHIIDLDSPWAPPRHLPHHTPWEVADVQWSPFAARDYWVVSTSNQKALVWNLAMSNSQASIEHVLHAHTRAITDINYSAHHPDILATCAIDSFVHCWDLRQPAKPALTFCDWFAGATQVKWNRQDSHMLASSHDKFLRIWDDRKGALPLRSIEAHDTKIYGLDWNRTRSNGIVTCSLDKTIKFWDCSSEVDEPECIIRTPFPVWRARHTPFGCGILAMPQRGNNDLHLYDRRLKDNLQKIGKVSPVHQFEGHQDQVKEFLWRPRGTITNGIDDREFQLVSWGADRILRLHHVDEKILGDVGHEKGQEVHRKLNLTRKNAAYKTFREDPSKIGSSSRKMVSMHSPSHRDTPVTVNTRSALSLGMSKAPIPIAGSWEKGGFMSSRAGIHGRVAARKDIDPIAWMKGVKIGKRGTDMQQSVTTAFSPSLTAERLWDVYDSLGDEITHVGDKFGNITFDEVDVHNRLVKISMTGPWGPAESPSYVQCQVMFPASYPKASTPTVTIEETASINRETILAIIKGVQLIGDAYLSHQRGSLEAILRYLHGDHTLKDSIAWLRAKEVDSSLNLADDGVESSSDEEDDDSDDFGNTRVRRTGMNDSALLESSDTNVNIPLPKACGALWADNGRLVCFFPPKEEKATSLLDTLNLQGQEVTGYRNVFEGFGQPHTRSPLTKPKTSTVQTIGETDSDPGSDSCPEDLYSSSSSSSASSVDFSLSQRPHYPSFTWRGSTLNSRVSKSAIEESQKSSSGISGTKTMPTIPKNVITIHNYEDLLPAKHALAEHYTLSGPDTCAHNAKVAKSQGQDDLADIWSFIAMIFSDEVPLETTLHMASNPSIDIFARRALNHRRSKHHIESASLDSKTRKPHLVEKGFIEWGQHPLGGQGFVRELISYLEHLANIQMLAMVTCFLYRFNAPRVDQYDTTSRHRRVSSRHLKRARGLSSSETVAAASEGNSDDYVSEEIVTNLPHAIRSKKSDLQNLEKLRSDPPSNVLSLGAPVSDGNTPSCTGASPPSTNTFSRRSFERSNPNIQSMSASPQQYKFSQRSNSNLSNAFTTPISLPFSFNAFGSSSPPNSNKKKTSPAGSYMAALAPSVTWGATSIFGHSSTSTEVVKSYYAVSDSSIEEKMFKSKKPIIKVNVRNQDRFQAERHAYASLLDPREEWRYQIYREAYANMLSVWNMPMARAEIVKCNGKESFGYAPFRPETLDDSQAPVLSIGRNPLREPHIPSRRMRLNFQKLCRSCNKSSPSHRSSVSKCSTCSAIQPPATCIFCFELIYGLASPCLGCGHTLHSTCRSHLLSLAVDLSSKPNSPAVNGACVTGCGCHCSEMPSAEVILPEYPPVPTIVEPEEDNKATGEDANEKEQLGWRNDEDVWEDIAYESLAKNLKRKGRPGGGRGVRDRASQIWTGDYKRGRSGHLRRDESF